VDSLTPMAQMGLPGPAPSRPLPLLPAVTQWYVSTGSRAEDANVEMVKASFTARSSNNDSGGQGWAVDDLYLPKPFVGKLSVKLWLDEWRASSPNLRDQIATSAGCGNFALRKRLLRAL
jgi:hypothetical protein